MLFQLIAQAFICVIAGFIYDLVGRRLTIAFSFLLMGAALFWTPYTLPSIYNLCLARMILGFAIQIQLGNPLINDYVYKNTRGKAVVF